MEVKRVLGKNKFRRQNNKAPKEVRPERASRLVPSSRLIDRLGTRKYVKDSAERRYIDFVPEFVSIPMSQHVGKPATPIVQKGARVAVGEPIAKTDENLLGAVIHASIDGVVKEVDERHIVIEKG